MLNYEPTSVQIDDTDEIDAAPVQTHKAGRKCKYRYPGGRVCGHTLSIYNPSNECWCHPIKEKDIGAKTEYCAKNRIYRRTPTGKCAFPGCGADTYFTSKHCSKHNSLIRHRLIYSWPLEMVHAPVGSKLPELETMAANGSIDRLEWYQEAIEHIKSGRLVMPVIKQGQRERQRIKQAERRRR